MLLPRDKWDNFEQDPLSQDNVVYWKPKSKRRISISYGVDYTHYCGLAPIWNLANRLPTAKKGKVLRDKDIRTHLLSTILSMSTLRDYSKKYNILLRDLHIPQPDYLPCDEFVVEARSIR